MSIVSIIIAFEIVIAFCTSTYLGTIASCLVSQPIVPGIGFTLALLLFLSSKSNSVYSFLVES